MIWLAAVAAAGPRCDGSPRSLTHVDVAVGDAAAAGRMAALALADVDGDGRAELYAAVVPQSGSEPMALWSTRLGADLGPAAAGAAQSAVAAIRAAGRVSSGSR